MPNLGAASGARHAERELRPGSVAWRRTTDVPLPLPLALALTLPLTLTLPLLVPLALT